MARWLMALLMVVGVAGCNTVAGVGQDISAGAHRVGSWFR